MKTPNPSHPQKDQLVIDLDNRTARIGDTPIDIRGRAFEMFTALAVRYKRPHKVNKNRLHFFVWGFCKHQGLINNDLSQYYIRVGNALDPFSTASVDRKGEKFWLDTKTDQILFEFSLGGVCVERDRDCSLYYGIDIEALYHEFLNRNPE